MKTTIIPGYGAAAIKAAIKAADNGSAGDRAYYQQSEGLWCYAYHIGYETTGGGHVAMRENVHAPDSPMADMVNDLFPNE